jgi:hypothetical protein
MTGMNIFEGCRRIGLLLRVVWLLGVTLFVVEIPPSLSPQTISYAVVFGVGGWITLFVLQAGIGWVARGFAGIPRGHDHRPEPRVHRAATSETL